MKPLNLEKRRRLPNGLLLHFWLSSLALLAGFLAGCSAPGVGGATGIIPEITSPTPIVGGGSTETTKTTIPTATETPSPIASLDPKVQELFTSQNVQYEVGANGSIQVDLYDTAEKDGVELNNFSRVDTQDGSNPNILTAKDQENNTYAYNPNEGWFQVPEVYNPMASIDWDKVATDNQTIGESPYQKELNTQLRPENYPEVEENFISDGRFNITQALYYENLPENQKISPEAPRGQYWISYDNDQLASITMYPKAHGGYAFSNYPEEYSNSGYNPSGRSVPPFIFGGLWKIHLNSGEYSYIIATTQKNPTPENPNELINLAYGFDQQGFEADVKNIKNGGDSNLLMYLNGLVWGGKVFSAIVRPPEQLPDGTIPPFDVNGGNEYFSHIGPNPVLGLRQIPGELISLFSPEDQAKIMEVLSTGFISPEGIEGIAPLSGLPRGFANRILFSKVGP